MKRMIVFIWLQVCTFSVFAQINTDRVIAIGRNALYFDDYILSIQYFNQVIRAKPWLAQPYFYRAIAKLSLDDYNGAEEDCTLALQQNPFLVQAFYVRGIARQSSGKYDLAIEDYMKGLEFRPKDRPMMTNTAIAYIQKKEFEKAKALFNELIESYPKDSKSYMARGAMYIETGDTLSAMNDYNKTIELDPYYAPAYGNRALLYYQTDKMDDAITDLNEAIRLNPREEGYYINRGLIRYNRNDLRGAMSDYDQVIAMNGNNLIARFNRGLLRSHIGDYNRAIEDFDIVIAMEPDNYMAYYNRALLHNQTGDFRSAVNDLDIIIDQYPNFTPAYYNRAEAKRRLNDISGADKDYWYAMELERTHGNVGQNNQPVIAATTVTPLSQASENPDKKPEEKKDTREESDKNISKFNNLVVYDKEEQQRSKYQSEIRGRVQDKNIRIDLQPQFVLTYYEKLDRIKESVYYNKTVENYNEHNTLGWKLIITNKEASLNEFQIEAHFTSINEYSSKIEKESNNADYYFGKGIDFMLVQDFAEAINNFDKAIEIDPSYILAYFNRAVVRYKQMEYEQSNTSQDELADAMSIQFNTSNTASRIPTQAIGNEHDNHSYTYEMILRDYNSVIQKDPSFIFAYFNRANLLCSQRDYKAAILGYNEAIRRDPEFAEAYFNRGLARLSQGDVKRGIADLSKAGELGIINAYNIIKRMAE
ncbi:MAG: tetratricopeptide repeat protein [Tannerella sp.]|jgi:tetratricopeptide (TPR) repeat protein|nr:tetratricopeptide repeat protein [Tannerella sp.]